MLESSIERKFVKEAQKRGFLALKMTGYAGIPDRLLLCNGEAIFVELKTNTGRLSKVQELVHTKLRGLGFKVFVVRDVNLFFNESI